jgi:DNA repair exonuclease SbcCD nuclease subunit
MKKLRKGAFLTDIHFGKKSNSPVHNEDCLRYINWFCDNVRKDPTIDYVGFLGDWNENRSAINIATINYSYQGGKLLNALGLPVYFVVGNHDLYHRHTREVHSIAPFEEFTNFHIIDQPVVIKEIGDGALFSPYLFHDEYTGLAEYLKLPFWAGHFEFKGFRITGYNIMMPTGPDPTMFAGPTRILSGHFHQRQTQGNITYIGNTFPMDFGDAGDFDRGMTVYDHVTEKMTFTNWKECPKYLRIPLSKVNDPKYQLPKEARVKIILDSELSFQDTTELRETLMANRNLRELNFEEKDTLDDTLTDTVTDAGAVVNEMVISDISTVDQLVIQMLGDIKDDKIDTQILIEQYKRLQ